MQSWWENTEKESEGGIGVNNCEGGTDVNNCGGGIDVNNRGGGIDVNNSLLGSRILFVLASSANRKQKPYIKRLADPSFCTALVAHCMQYSCTACNICTVLQCKM